MDQLQQTEFEVQTLLLAIAKIVKGAQDNGEKARELFFTEGRGGAGSTAALLQGDLQKLCGDAGGIAFRIQRGDFGDDAVAEKPGELPCDLLGSIAKIQQMAHGGQHRGGVVVVNGSQDVLKDDIGDRAHEVSHFSKLDVRAAIGQLRGGGDGLVHDRQGIAHGPVTRFGEQAQGGVIDSDMFVVGDLA